MLTKKFNFNKVKKSEKISTDFMLSKISIDIISNQNMNSKQTQINNDTHNHYINRDIKCLNKKFNKNSIKNMFVEHIEEEIIIEKFTNNNNLDDLESSSDEDNEGYTESISTDEFRIQPHLELNKENKIAKMNFIKKFNHKDDAKELMKISKKSILVKNCIYTNDYYLFKDSKTFYEELMKLDELDRTFHELPLEDSPQRMFCDIDVPKEQKIDKIILLHHLFHLMTEIFEKVGFEKFELNKASLLMSKGEKTSFHFFYHNKKVFKNYNHQKRFWNYVYNYIKRKCPDLGFTNKKNNYSNVIDLQVYAKEHMLRTINSTKTGEKRHLIPVEIYEDKNGLHLRELKVFDIEKYFILVPQRKFYYNVLQVPVMKNKIDKYTPDKEKNSENIDNGNNIDQIICYDDNEPIKFRDMVLQSEYGFAQICYKRIDNIKFIDDNNNICYKWDDNKKLWEERGLKVIIDLVYKAIYKDLKLCLDDAEWNFHDSDNDFKKNKYKKLMNGYKDALKKIGLVRTRKNVIEELRVKLLDMKFAKNMNRCEYGLPTKNGKFIDLKTKEVRQRTKKDYFTFELDVNYDKETRFPNVMKLINPMFLFRNDLINFVHRRLGYCLSENYDNKEFYVWHGNGDNGKSAVMNIMKDILKKYYATASRSVFVQSSKNVDSRSASPHLITLKNKRIAIFSELKENEILNATEIKRITGGDEINARALFKGEEQFIPFCKLYLLTNEIPHFNCNDDAFLNRLNCIPFDAEFVNINKRKKINNENVFEAKPDFIKKFKDKGIYQNEFFSWLVEGCYQYVNDKEGNIKPNIINTSTQNLVEDIDNLKQFIDDEFNVYNKDSIENEKEYYVLANTFYERYNLYCSTNKICTDMIISKRKIKSVMDSKGYKYKQKRINDERKRIYSGLKIKPVNNNIILN